MAGRAAIVVGRPALDRRQRPLNRCRKESAGPVEAVAVGPGRDQVEGHAVLGQPVREAAVLSAIVLGSELTAASPALVADAPVADAERLAAAVGRPLV